MPQQFALRTGRFSVPQRIYHMVTTTADRVHHFRDFASARIVVRCLQYENTKHVDTLAYCLMSNHLHWLFQLRDNTRLEDVMQAVKSVSSHRINRRLRRSGSIWGPGYFDRGLKDEHDPNTTINYILRNPVRAGMVKDIRFYTHWDAAEIPFWVMGAFTASEKDRGGGAAPTSLARGA